MNTLELSPFERGSIPNCSRPLSICIPCFHTFSSINRSSIETRSSRANRDPPSLIKIFLRMGEEWSRINEETLAFEVASITLPYPQMPSDNEAFSRNRVPRNFKVR